MIDINTLRDLTDEIIQRNEDIKNSHYDLKNLFMVMSDMIFVMDVNHGYIHDINNAVYKILDYSIDELKMHPLFEFINNADKIINDLYEYVDGVSESNNKVNTGFNEIIEIEFKHKNGSIVYTECKVHCAMWNNIKSFIIISRVTNQKYIELESAYQELKTVEKELKNQISTYQMYGSCI